MLRAKGTGNIAVVDKINSIEVSKMSKNQIAIGFAQTEQFGDVDSPVEHMDMEYMCIDRKQAAWLIKQLKKKLKK